MYLTRNEIYVQPNIEVYFMPCQIYFFLTSHEQPNIECLVEKGELQKLREETPTENQPSQRFRWQPHH
jgi:hypothetical protein